MRVSTKGRYGLRIMLELALQHGSGPVLVSTIAQKQSLPGKHIHVLVGGLKAAGLVRALRGPNGGLELAREPNRITLDVVAALEGRITEPSDPATLDRPEDGVALEVWEDLATAMEVSLGRYTLAQLAERMKARAGATESYII